MFKGRQVEARTQREVAEVTLEDRLKMAGACECGWEEATPQFQAPCFN